MAVAQAEEEPRTESRHQISSPGRHFYRIMHPYIEYARNEGDPAGGGQQVLNLSQDVAACVRNKDRRIPEVFEFRSSGSAGTAIRVVSQLTAPDPNAAQVNWHSRTNFLLAAEPGAPRVSLLIRPQAAATRRDRDRLSVSNPRRPANLCLQFHIRFCQVNAITPQEVESMSARQTQRPQARRRRIPEWSCPTVTVSNTVPLRKASGARSYISSEPAR